MDYQLPTDEVIVNRILLCIQHVDDIPQSAIAINNYARVLLRRYMSTVELTVKFHTIHNLASIEDKARMRHLLRYVQITVQKEQSPLKTVLIDALSVRTLDKLLKDI